MLGDALVFCWTVNRRLREAIDLVEQWGTRYWFTMTWHKNWGNSTSQLSDVQCRVDCRRTERQPTVSGYSRLPNS